MPDLLAAVNSSSVKTEIDSTPSQNSAKTRQYFFSTRKTPSHTDDGNSFQGIVICSATHESFYLDCSIVFFWRNSLDFFERGRVLQKLAVAVDLNIVLAVNSGVETGQRLIHRCKTVRSLLLT